MANFSLIPIIHKTTAGLTRFSTEETAGSDGDCGNEKVNVSIKVSLRVAMLQRRPGIAR